MAFSSRLSALLIVAQALLGAVFVFAGLMKLVAGSDGIKVTLVGAGIDHPPTVLLLSKIIPPGEIVLGLWLALGVIPRVAIGISIAFLSAATIALIGLGMSSGWSVTCYCTGLQIGDAVGLAIVRNFVLLLLGVWIARRLDSSPLPCPATLVRTETGRFSE